jgi:hypothetical protein
MTFFLIKPEGRRRLWRVEERINGKRHGAWVCDSEAIARELLRRLRNGKPPGWIARDLRLSDKEE